jgi:hypothetical protein
MKKSSEPRAEIKGKPARIVIDNFCPDFPGQTAKGHRSAQLTRREKRLDLPLTARDQIERIAKAYGEPGRDGAALQVSPDGIVGNGFVVVARFTTKIAAERALRNAGFYQLAYGWKLRRKDGNA